MRSVPATGSDHDQIDVRAEFEQRVGGAATVDRDLGVGVDRLDRLHRAFSKEIDVGADVAVSLGDRR